MYSNSLAITFTTLICTVILCVNNPAEAKNGKFSGPVVVQNLPDGRNFRVVRSFTYVDSLGQLWFVPRGTETDGASVPRVLWSIYPPFSGKYRDAAVLHDRYCQSRSTKWQQVHRVFYDAMRSSNVDEATAKIMYSAVWFFGPRWDGSGKVTRSVGHSYSKEERQRLLKAMIKWISNANPSVDEIEARINHIVR